MRTVYLHFLSILWFTLLNFVSIAQDEATTINWIPTSNKVLGLGVDLNNIDKWNPPAFTFKIDTIRMGVSGESHLKIVESKEQLIQALGFEAGIAARNLNFSVETKFGFSKESISNEYNLTLVLTAKEYYDLIMVNQNSINLTKRAEVEIKKNFKDVFGSYYIGAARTGSMIAIIITIHTNSIAVKQSLSASLKGSYKSGAFNASGFANFKDEMDRKSGSINLEVDVKYYGIKSNDKIQTLIKSFKSDVNDKYDLNKLLDESANTFSSMSRTDAAPLLLSLSSFNTLDPRLEREKVDLNNDLLNFHLSRVQDEYFKVKNKLKEVLNLLNMEDINYWKFFNTDSSSYNEQLSKLIKESKHDSSETTEVYKEIINKVKIKYNFNKSLFDRYSQYSETLSSYLFVLKDIHKCYVEGFKDCKFKMYNLDNIYIPEKYTPIFFWQGNSEQKYAYAETIIDHTIRNLKKKTNVIVKYNLIGRTVKACGDQTQLKIGLSSNAISKDVIIRNSFTGPTFNGDGFFDSETDENGELTLRLYSFLNWCPAGNIHLSFDPQSSIEIEYK